VSYLSAQSWCQELINILNRSGDACPVEVDREGKETQKRKGFEGQRTESENRRGQESFRDKCLLQMPAH
jgi:hypothetical protein